MDDIIKIYTGDTLNLKRLDFSRSNEFKNLEDFKNYVEKCIEIGKEENYKKLNKYEEKIKSLVEEKILSMNNVLIIFQYISRESGIYYIKD